jgi:cytochrome c biogenesis protein CcmG/thiol:disulfide interchange protein DsbE
MRSPAPVVTGLVLSAVLSALLAGCASGDRNAGAAPGDTPPSPVPFAACPEQPDEAAAVGAALPPLAFDCLGGGTLDLGRAPGVPTVINLWGSWCGPCREELPLLQEFADAAGDRVRVLGVISKDRAPQAGSFASDAGVRFPSAFDADGRLMAQLGLNGLPYTAFVAADGSLVHSELGQIASVQELEVLVAEHLGVQL